MIKWERPSGTEITTNEEKATVEAAEALGWKRANEPKKRGPKPSKSE